jgi:hypothetical protein
MANTCADGKARLIGASGTLYVVPGCAVCCTAIGKPAPQTVNSTIRIMFPHSFLLSSNAKSSIETVIEPRKKTAIAMMRLAAETSIHP